jgi:hypothetical protein
MLHQIGMTQNNIPVRVDLVNSRAAKQIAQRPHLLTLASEVVSVLSIEKSHLIATYDMGRTIGYDFVVEVTDKDTVFYAQLVKETIFTSFTKRGEPASTRLLTMLFGYDETDGFLLVDLWPGSFRPPRPGDTTETKTSKAFWSTHAYVFEDQHLRPSSITKTCPY